MRELRVECEEGNFTDDAFVVRRRQSDGLIDWSAHYGRPAVRSYDSANDLGLDDAGNLHLTGRTSSCLQDETGGKIRRDRYTAIDDATRNRALKGHRRHHQTSAIDFLDHVVERFPFRIDTIRTDRGHEFQAQFHRHADDNLRHIHIKPRNPQLNGKVETSHLTDREEFYPLLSYKGDVDLAAKLAGWERFYNDDRPHGAFRGRTPYEALRDLMKQS